MTWGIRPQLERPILVTAFGGWNDAGDAATSALRFLCDEWGADPVAKIDPDNYYDFTQVRPNVVVDEDGQRRIDWPSPEVLATDDTTTPAAVLVTGTEPQHHWRAFCDDIIDIARTVGAERVIHLGALLAEVPHSRPVPVTASGRDGDPAANRATRYQGPTGIVGVLHHACETAGLHTTSLWAAVPTYVSGASSPKAALALVKRIARLIDQPIAAGLLEISAQAYEGEISQLVNDDEDTAAYVKRLEHDFDEDTESSVADGLTDEIERFLRDHPR